MNITLRCMGLLKLTILHHVERILNAKINAKSVEIHVRIKFKEVKLNDN